MDSEPEFSIPNAKECEAINNYIEAQAEFMAPSGFFTRQRNALIRRHAVSVIAKHTQGDDPDQFIPYLAINYFDRYFSTSEFQDVEGDYNDAEKVRLIAICCLTISAKMRTKSFCVEQFLEEKAVNISHQSIMRMELRILDVLNWRMRPVTAFCFLNYYYLYFKDIGEFKRRCINEIIVQAQGENDFVNCKPSHIAMLAFLAATNIAYPSKINDIDYPSELSEYFDKMVNLCHRKNIEIELGGGSGTLSTSSKIVIDSSEEDLEDETALIPRRRDKGKAVVLGLEADASQGKAAETTSDDEVAAKVEAIGIAVQSRHERLEWAEKVIAPDVAEETEEEQQTLAKGKAVAVAVAVAQASEGEIVEEIEAQQRSLAKGKAVVVAEAVKEKAPEIEEDQPRPEQEKKDAQEEEDVAKIEAAIKQALEKGKAKVVGGSSISEIVPVSELVPKKLMNFQLKWPTDVPSLEGAVVESQQVGPRDTSRDVSIKCPITIRGTGNDPPMPHQTCGCANCSIG